MPQQMNTFEVSSNRTSDREVPFKYIIFKGSSGVPRGGVLRQRSDISHDPLDCIVIDIHVANLRLYLTREEGLSLKIFSI